MVRPLAAVLAVLLVSLAAASGGDAPWRPHIVTILTDDQGFGDAGFTCENSTGMCALTPNLDALALSSSSAYFHRFYAAAAVCSPTRAAYLTGRTNQRSCIASALACDTENPATTCSQGKGLPWSEFTTAKAAKMAGYDTAMFGKASDSPPGAAGQQSRCLLPCRLLPRANQVNFRVSRARFAPPGHFLILADSAPHCSPWLFANCASTSSCF